MGRGRGQGAGGGKIEERVKKKRGGVRQAGVRDKSGIRYIVT